MANEVKITVVVPVHNSEKYLKECLESALSQSFKDIEILCIDGGSKDASFEIIKKIQEKDDRIVYISDSDTGYGHKLNIGIGKARGKYISILESDDRMGIEMLERLYEIAQQYDADIVDADYYNFFNHGGKEYFERVIKYSKLDCYNHLINFADFAEKEIVTSGIWTALYRKEFLEQQNIYLNESEGASYQDASFLFLTSILAKNVYHLSIPLYQYRVDNVGSSVKDDRKIFEIIYEMEFLKNDLEKRDIHDQSVWKLYYIRKYNAFYWNYCRLSPHSKEIFLKEYLKELELDIQRGVINRENFTGSLYERTFLIIDSKENFINKVIEKEGQTWQEKFCKLFDLIRSYKVVIFGVGMIGTRLVGMLQQNEGRICGICDNSSSLQGTKNNQYMVCSVKEAVERFKDALYIITCREHSDEMKRQLIREGIKETNIIIFGDK